VGSGYLEAIGADGKREPQAADGHGAEKTLSNGSTKSDAERMRPSRPASASLLGATVWGVAVVAVGCGAPGAGESVEAMSSAIVGGTAASAYPEAVVVTSSGLIPCSGVVLAPRAVLTAGHCRSLTKSYAVLAPNAKGQQATGSADWTSYTGDPAASSDTLLIFLDAPIELASYPVIGATEVAGGTSVVDIGRTLNGVISMSDYVSPPVKILGPGDSLGFPWNYQAQPDISQDGDSGGPIEIPGSTPHTVVAIVDTDTVEQNVTVSSPIDLFARLDLVRTTILAQIAAHEVPGASHADGGSDAHTVDGGAGDAQGVRKDAGDAAHATLAADAGHVVGAARPVAGGSCSLPSGPALPRGYAAWTLLMLGLAGWGRRRSRQATPG